MASTLSEALMVAGVPRALQQRRACLGKRRYPTREAAAGVQASDGWRLEPYACEFCHGWHLSKKPQWKGGKRR